MILEGLDKNEYKGGILLHMQENIPSQLILMKKSTVEGFFIELN